MDTQPAGDGASYSEDWAAIAQEETGQAEAPPGTEGHDRAGPGEQDSGQPQPDAEGERQGPDAAPPPAGSETADDIWASADPTLKSAFEAERARAAAAENTIRSNNGRWSAAQRENMELRARLSQPAPRGDAAPGSGAAPEAETADLDAGLAKAGDEYPDIAMPIIKVIDDLRSQVAELKTDATRRRELDLRQAELSGMESMAREEQALAQDHPDWDAVVKSQDFAEWAMAQPRMVHEALLRNGEGIVDGAEAAKILSDFKREKGSAPPENHLAQKRDRQLDGARHVPARPGAQPGEGQGGSYSDEWKRLAAEEQRREASRR